MVADGKSVDPLDCFLALDFGGTKLSAAVISREAREWESHRMTESGTQAYESLESILDLSHELLKGRKPAAIGVSFGGPVIVETGHVVRSFQVAGWDNFPLKSKLQSEFKAPVIIDNDANAAALGEARFGAGRDCKNLFFITVSTGIGGGWIRCMGINFEEQMSRNQGASLTAARAVPPSPDATAGTHRSSSTA